MAADPLSSQIPRSALVLGLLGLLPFLWGAWTVVAPDWALWGARTIGPRFVGPYVQLAYGQIILAFMSGVLWGFATRTQGKAANLGYCLSVIPALWAFIMTGGGPISAALSLTLGFSGLLILDWVFWHFGLAPRWWMKLRLLLTTIVVVCLLSGVLV